MKKKNIRKSVFVVAIVLSVVLYFLGVISGLYASKVIEEDTNSKISLFKSETRADLLRLEEGTARQIVRLDEYTQFLERTVTSMQLEQLFLEGVADEERCAFTAVTLDQLNKDMQYYRERLPVRLEEYEKERELGEEYFFLKQQYNALSIRNWIVVRNQHGLCDTQEIPALYFYTAECEDCVEQGEELDMLADILEEQNKSIVLFTVDANDQDPMIQFLLTYYEIEDFPAIVLEQEAYSGKVFTAQELEVKI